MKLNKKNIQELSYETKTLGRGKLIKKNKVLVSVLTTSMFLIPTIGVNAEAGSTISEGEAFVLSTLAVSENGIADFPQELNSLSSSIGTTFDAASKAKVNRYIYGNFGGWQAFRTWGDDRVFSVVGNGTVTWGNKTGPNSGKGMYLNSKSENDGVMWSLDLMPNTNYTFQFENRDENFSKMPNTTVTIADGDENVLTSGKIRANSSITLYTFKTPEGTGPVPITVKVLGVMNNQGISGDFFFTAKTPSIVALAGNEYTQTKKLSEVMDKTVASVLADNQMEFYDNANNKTRVEPKFDSAGETIITSASVASKKGVFSGSLTATKWGKSTQAKYSVTIIDDVKYKKILDDTADDTKKAISEDPTLNEAEKNAQIKNVDDVLKKAKADIDQKETEADIKTIADKGNIDIKAQHVKGTPLTDQKDVAIKVLEEVVTSTNEKIEGDTNLSPEEKALQKENVKKSFENAKKDIGLANNVEEIAKALETGSEKIKKEYVSGKSLDELKIDALADLDKVAQDTIKKINDDENLTNQTKKDQINAVNETKAQAEQAMNATTTAEELSNALEKGKETIITKYVPGEKLSKQIEDAISELEKVAKATVAAIDTDETLTDSEKEKQKAEVEKVLKDESDQLSKVTTAEELVTSLESGKHAIEAEHKVGKTLDEHKSEANISIDNAVKTEKEKIANDPTLTDDEKVLQNQEVDEKANVAKEAVLAAIDWKTVQEVRDIGVGDIGKTHQSGTGLEARKEDAKAAIDAEVTRIKKRITDDPTLTVEEKEAQAAGVDAVADQAKKSIELSNDANGVDAAKGAGITEINGQYKTGSPLDARKKDAKTVIDTEVTKIKERIANDPTLSDEEKATQSAGVDIKAEEAKVAIEQATTANDVDSAKGQGIANINQQYQPGTGLELRKEEAKSSIQVEADLIKDRITNDPTLTPSEKATQIAAVDAETANAKAAIDTAIDANGVDVAKGTGITAINNQYQPGTSIEDRRSDALAAIEAERIFINEKIANDPTLSDEDKDIQTAAADQAASEAVAAINSAQDASSIDIAKGQGIVNIDYQYQSGQPIEDRKADAIAAIEAERDAVKSKINNDPTLTVEEKSAQITLVDQSATNAINEITVATDITGIDSAKGQGIVNIDGAYQPGTSLEIRKEQAKAGIDDASSATKERIAKDPTLTSEEKVAQTAGVDQSAIEAKANIDAAIDANGIDTAKGQGVTDIDGNYQPGLSIETRKEQAKADIDEAATAVKEKITKDQSLTEEEKEKQIADVSQSAINAKSVIDAAENLKEVDQAKGQGVTNIDNAYQPGSRLEIRKEQALSDVDKAAKATKEKITNDPTLTEKDKAEQIEAVVKETEEAKKAIKSATNASEVDAAKGKGIENIDNQYQPGTTTPGDTLETKKDKAKAEIDEVAKATKAKISKDDKLSDAEKATQTKAVEAEATKAKAAIDGAKNESEVDKALTTGTTSIK
ncbi:DUF1542 domain-containing protein, partial [Vagococcus silagei]